LSERSLFPEIKSQEKSLAKKTMQPVALYANPILGQK
jgi:hypothetical protein